MIEQIANLLGLGQNEFDVHTKTNITPLGKPLLNKNLEGKPRKKDWKYCTAIGMLTYLQRNTHPEIVCEPDKSTGIECYVDADFAGGWNITTSADADNIMSFTGFLITYANCPIYWASCLQTEIALCTTEAEYIAMSSALHEVIPLMTLMKELHTIFPVHTNKPNFFCKVHEVNQSRIKMATADKFTP